MNELRELASAQSSAPFHVLVVEEDSGQTEVVTNAIRDVVQSEVDVMSRRSLTEEWMARSNYHLVVLDEGLGQEEHQNTMELLEDIKRFSPVTSVIVIAKQATVEKAVEAVRLGAEDYLCKPLDLEAFRKGVRRCVDKRQIYGESSGLSSYLSLVSTCQMISASMEKRRIFNVVRSYLAREVNASHSAIFCRRGGQIVHIDDRGEDEIGENDHPHRSQALDEVVEVAIAAVNPFKAMMDSNEAYHFFERGKITPGLFVFKFYVSNDEEYYCVCLTPNQPQDMATFEQCLKMLGLQIEVTGKNIQEYLGVKHLVYVDEATGLYNTRYMSDVLDSEIKKADQSESSFAVLFLDVDRFKMINDTHGHLVGTKLLSELGRLLKNYVRHSDILFRYGGDEFVAILANCDLNTAKTVAERIRVAVEQRDFLQSEGLAVRFTVSIGVALYPDHAKSKKAVMDAADQAMYAAKKRHRNVVTVAEVGLKTFVAVGKEKKSKSRKNNKKTKATSK